jgi:predicted aconitase with swiveling domain
MKENQFQFQIQIQIKGRVIRQGCAEGEVLFSMEPIGFFGHVDPETGIIMEKNHILYGKSISGKILIFPHAKGSTVGAYTLYALKKNGKAPLAIINRNCESIIAVGAIIADIPVIDMVDISRFKSGDKIRIHDGVIDMIN